MSFDMSQCKIGDKLVCRNGVIATYIGDNSSAIFPHKVKANYKGLSDFSVCVTSRGSLLYGRGFSGYDIVGFYKEEDKMIERDKEYDLKVTGEQLALIFFLLGKTVYVGRAYDLYKNIKEFLGVEDNLSIKCKLSPIEYVIEFENIEECMFEIFKQPKTEEQKNLRELKEQYKLLGDKINQLEGK